ncbi:Rubredoxin-like domain [Sesbania bispinosa]|nr:Rubredoxin-like domain [Sesbania bispinosa]
MSAVVAGGSSSSCSATFTTRSNHCIKNCHTPLTPFKTLTLPHCQKTSLQGLSLHEAKRGVSDSFLGENKNGSSIARRRLEITARTAGASKTIEAEVDKPLGLTLGQKPGGGVVITAVDGGGNAARAGLKAGDQVLYTSSFFGDELWPADKLGFTKTAIQAKPDSVYFVVSRRLVADIFCCCYITEVCILSGAEVDVKRLPKRPAPPRFGRKLTEAQKARIILEATHICLDCGYIYTLQKPFAEQPDTYGCPQCQAPKKRFAPYDVNTGKAIGGGLPPISVIIALVAGVGAVGALLVYGLQ